MRGLGALDVVHLSTLLDSCLSYVHRRLSLEYLICRHLRRGISGSLRASSRERNICQRARDKVFRAKPMMLEGTRWWAVNLSQLLCHRNDVVVSVQFLQKAKFLSLEPTPQAATTPFFPTIYGSPKYSAGRPTLSTKPPSPQLARRAARGSCPNRPGTTPWARRDRWAWRRWPRRTRRSRPS